MTEKVGIVGYGVCVPYARIKTEEIAEAWEKTSDPGKSLLIREKAVPNYDEDTVTLSVEAAQNAIARADLKVEKIGAVFVGSESHPYAVKSTSGIVAQALGLGQYHMSMDTEFACKAGTAAMQAVTGLVISGMIEYGLAIGADTAQGAPGDPLEYSAAAGAGAYIIGRKNVAAELIDTLSITTDTPDFWRRPGEIYPKHGGRFTGEPAYYYHVEEATRAFLTKTKTEPNDYDYVVFHMPNGKFPRTAAQRLGFKKEQLETGLTVDLMGNPYSAASLVGLARVLDKAKPGKKILVTSYGSGSGSDTFSFLTTSLLEKIQNKARIFDDYLRRKKYVSYSKYLRMTGKLSS